MTPDPVLSTAWSRSLGLRVPIVNAPMGGAAGGRLAAAVCESGGLGMIGMGSAGSAQALRRELSEAGGAPVGIGLVDWVRTREADLLDTALAARPRALSISFGADFSWVPEVQAAGILAITQVYDVPGAHRAQEAGIDVIVARGSEGGGHGADRLALMPLLDAVLEIASVPVLAAGGIGSGRTLAAVLAAGASGAWLGTCLAAAEESLLGENARRAMLAADSTSTVVTTEFDEALDLPWPPIYPARVLRNEFTDPWTRAEGDENPPGVDDLRTAIAADDPRIAPVDAGQGVGLVTHVEPVAETIARLCAEAAELLTAD
ncbi:NAD(P)H-dependent flavin oxidoreductase [Nocardia rosealba]|uniref:NAD(P)H-dependent flavin oxidoreductase n=1 Tax=Nocardia rosealba TaxID=2878563 RepID=UPI001CD9EFE6|nr:nitronate monooxygenase [Nocardia rosealba]MCA2209150.1 nitronate monooxygenase [Nocardia rosealba]